MSTLSSAPSTVLVQPMPLQTRFTNARATNIIAQTALPSWITELIAFHFLCTWIGQETLVKYYGIFDRLSAVLKKDSVPYFLRIFENNRECFLVLSSFHKPRLNYSTECPRCANVVLEGSRLGSADTYNPNYMTSFGYFLHQAAESFSADMVELLWPPSTHVAIENACQHKYLEDNLLVDENYRKGNVEYIYKLVHLLCLPEMQGKLVPAAILLLAAQRQYRNLNGFDIIKACIEDCKKQLKEMKVHLINALVLVRIILKAVEALEAYIQTHSENYDVGPSGKEIGIEDLDCCPYDCGEPVWNTGLTKAATGSPTLEVKEKSAVTKKPRDSHLHARNQFFPVWRSVLTARFISKIFPAYAPKKELPIYTRDVNYPGGSEKLRAERHSEFRLGMLERNYPRVANPSRKVR
ncbi:hypothetical protein ZWY2020_017049 [Hordeum vulgare]|nr:hypothetical protein ZWY2020_017049 [Hordeum vulgare]